MQQTQPAVGARVDRAVRLQRCGNCLHLLVSGKAKPKTVYPCRAPEPEFPACVEVVAHARRDMLAKDGKTCPTWTPLDAA